MYQERGPIPHRWLHCPRKSEKPILDKFFAFKTPLSYAFDQQVPRHHRFSVSMLLDSVRRHHADIGLWIDLTNTTRYYDREDVEQYDIQYFKLRCKGHGETPSEEETKEFVKACKTFIAANPSKYIGVHCTHGFNRTGYLIISYLLETEQCTLHSAIALFAEARPPGIYKGDYLENLFYKYGNVRDTPDPPLRPAWCLEYNNSNQHVHGQNARKQDKRTFDDSLNQEPLIKKRRRYSDHEIPVFMANVTGVKPLVDSERVSAIQREIQKICHWKGSGFPGSQPVSMDVNNLCLLSKKPYRVSWKADGTRYMMFIQSNGRVYFINRDNSVFEVEGLTFPRVADTAKRLRDTLLDGEMVMDKFEKKEFFRYLVYDVIKYDGRDVSQLSFYPERCDIIERDIIAGRHKAMKEGKIDKAREPFSLRVKSFWNITQTKKLFGEKFSKQLSHEPDGLIFQPAEDAYQPGTCPDVLKWKPASMNSVDFRLKIEKERREGMVHRSVGALYVGQHNRPFGYLRRLTDHLKTLDDRIIECKFENGSWVFMRERTDKSYPNSYNTAHSVCSSIQHPINKEYLLDYIDGLSKTA
ncbi:hypothetical protein QAD02_000563 [Eretmocerus hayati]|uniref:Uncharacterized protein n=1 Tax=Eretmocerus hayati TaxID=131215 RepID=A0ACC2NG38_9HYME|nr:hypothetical protein QAD02_000563 [Eretmocerus hayati]